MNLDSSKRRDTFTYPVDACMRPLQIPKELQHYIEDHDIYRIFADLSTEIISKKPEDVLMFIKNFLESYRGDKPPRIILIGLKLDRKSLITYLKEKLNCAIITYEDVLARICLEDENNQSLQSHSDVREKTRSDLCENTSIPDFFKNELFFDLEAPPSYIFDKREESLEKKNWMSNPSFNFFHNNNIGSHVDMEKLLGGYLHGQRNCEPNDADIVQTLKTMVEEFETNGRGWILLDIPRNKNEAQTLNKDFIIPTHVIALVSNQNRHQNQLENQLVLEEMKQTYQRIYTEVLVCNKSVEDLGKEIVKIIDKPTFHFGAVKNRIVIIGQNSLEHLGNHLARNRKLVHIHMREPTVTNNLISRLQEIDCLDHGYVLTGFPPSVDMLRHLQETLSAPNYVIFLQENTPKTSQQSNQESQIKSRFMFNPPCSQVYQKKADVISTEVKFQKLYQQRISIMLDYCGQSAIEVDTACDLHTLFARVENALDSHPPRSIAKKCTDTGKFNKE